MVSNLKEINDVDFPLKTGELFAERYFILKKIGQGAHAEIYKAQDRLNNNNLVALKIILRQEDNWERQKINLDIEKEAFAKLMFNPNVIGLKDFDNSQKLFYMVIDLVTGSITMQTHFRSFYNLLTESELIYYFTQIGQGLLGIHKSGLVHRDIKPQNILLTNDEIVKISDFGISKVANEELRYGVNQGFEGTPKYVSPEQYLDVNNFYIESDIYSMGVMLYEFATGVAPYITFREFKDSKDRYVFILNQHLKQGVIRPKVFNLRLSQSMDNIIMKCLAKDKKNRYHNLEEFLDDLSKIDLNQNIKTKPIDISNYFSDSTMRRTIKKTNEYRFERFFKWTSTKPILLFVVVFLILFFIVPLSIFWT